MLDYRDYGQSVEPLSRLPRKHFCSARRPAPVYWRLHCLAAHSIATTTDRLPSLVLSGSSAACRHAYTRSPFNAAGKTGTHDLSHGREPGRDSNTPSG